MIESQGGSEGLRLLAIGNQHVRRSSLARGWFGTRADLAAILWCGTRADLAAILPLTQSEPCRNANPELQLPPSGRNANPDHRGCNCHLQGSLPTLTIGVTTFRVLCSRRICDRFGSHMPLPSFSKTYGPAMQRSSGAQLNKPFINSDTPH